MDPPKMAECVAVKIPYLFPQFLVLALLCSIQSPGAKPVGPPKGGKDSLVFVYVHGFDGTKEAPEFCNNLQEFFVVAKVPPSLKKIRLCVRMPL